jgi:hypothetical protein
VVPVPALVPARVPVQAARSDQAAEPVHRAQEQVPAVAAAQAERARE